MISTRTVPSLRRKWTASKITFAKRNDRFRSVCICWIKNLSTSVALRNERAVPGNAPSRQVIAKRTTALRRSASKGLTFLANWLNYARMEIKSLEHSPPSANANRRSTGSVPIFSDNWRRKSYGWPRELDRCPANAMKRNWPQSRPSRRVYLVTGAAEALRVVQGAVFRVAGPAKTADGTTDIAEADRRRPIAPDAVGRHRGIAPGAVARDRWTGDGAIIDLRRRTSAVRNLCCVI